MNQGRRENLLTASVIFISAVILGAEPHTTQTGVINVFLGFVAGAAMVHLVSRLRTSAEAQ